MRVKYDGEVISLWGTSPLTAKNNSGTAPKTSLCKGSLPQLYPAFWQLLVPDLQHTCLYSPAQCLQLVQCCSLMISLCTQLSSVELLPVQSSSTFHLHTWLLLPKPNALHLSWLNSPRLPNSLASLAHPSSHSYYPDFLMLHEIYLRNWWKLVNPMRLLKALQKPMQYLIPFFCWTSCYAQTK